MNPMTKSDIPSELALAAHYLCDLDGKQAKAFSNSKKRTLNWEVAAETLRTHINCQRALFLASRQIAAEEAEAKQASNGHAAPADDLDSLPDPLVILP
jgi:hypothetical protein